MAIGALILALLVAAGIWWYVTDLNRGAVPLAPAPAGSTAALTFSGVFPAAEDPALKNPIGIVIVGERVFVAESDAGVVREFAANGARRPTIALPRASAKVAAYPTDLAAVGSDKLAVVDTASSRVLLISLANGRAEPAAFGAGEPSTAPKNPTAVAGLADGTAVADGADHLIKVYGADGVLLRTLGASLQPPLGFVGGMALVGKRLYVADSNAGRVVALDPQTGQQLASVPDRLGLPRGVTSAGGERLLIAATFGRSLSLYDRAGLLLGAAAQDTKGLDEAGWFVLPKGVAYLESTRRAYVSDAGDGRIRVYNVAAAGGK